MQSLTINQIIQAINYANFQKIVEKYKGDKWKKSFSCWNQMKVMLFFHLSEAKTLRSLVTSLRSTYKSLYHSGIGSISLNNLSHANTKRNCKIFEDTFYQLQKSLESKTEFGCKKFRFKNDLIAYDSSTISLCLNLFEWAKFRSTKSGIKMHTGYNIKKQITDDVMITNANVHDTKAFSSIKIKKDCIYILDRAYCDTKGLYSLVKNGAYFVTRIKKNFKYKIKKKNHVSLFLKKAGVITDWEIDFTRDKYYNYPESVRLVIYKDIESGKEFEFLTNMKDLSAKTIADIYKNRWAVETFFKTIKQNLKIKHFIGNNENAVRIQIWTALIVYLLFKWHQYNEKIKMGLTEFIAIVKNNLLKRCSLLKLLHKELYRDIVERRKIKQLQGWLF